MEIALLFLKTNIETTNHPTQSKGEGVCGEGAGRLNSSQASELPE